MHNPSYRYYRNIQDSTELSPSPNNTGNPYSTSCPCILSFRIYPSFYCNTPFPYTYRDPTCNLCRPYTRLHLRIFPSTDCKPHPHHTSRHHTFQALLRLRISQFRGYKSAPNRISRLDICPTLHPCNLPSPDHIPSPNRISRLYICPTSHPCSHLSLDRKPYPNRISRLGIYPPQDRT